MQSTFDTQKKKDMARDGGENSGKEETYNFKSVRESKQGATTLLPHIGKLVKIECNLMNQGDSMLQDSTRTGASSSETMPFTSKVGRFLLA